MPTTTIKKVATKKVATPKKSVAKKATTKVANPKVSTKTVKSKLDTKAKKLVYADNQRSFWVSNGQILNSLLALSEALSGMEKSVYTHHVNKERHDFADWVERVLVDASCATDLRQAKTPASAKTVVVRHLKLYRL